MKKHAAKKTRHLVLLLGDQLDRHSAAFDGVDPAADAVWMAEVPEESTHVWSHKARITMFLSAMRHFRDALKKEGLTVHYRLLDHPENRGSLSKELTRSLKQLKPKRLISVLPGAWRVQKAVKKTAEAMHTEIDIRPDRHFLSSPEAFSQYAAQRKQLRMEFFYRQVRRKTGILMVGDKPEGGKWNFDAENRQGFGKEGPGPVPAPRSFPPDAVTREVMAAVEKRFPDHPGSLKRFDWPITPKQARLALDDFIDHRLHRFGPYQDAMWTGEPYLYHSRLSAAMNVKLLNPREVVAAAEKAYHAGKAPLNSVEGFIRQIIGWREYVRGVYWLFMPDYLNRNTLGAAHPLPRFYWTGETDMNCLRQAIGQTLEYGLCHHIQRLMVTGLFALLLGVKPQEVHAWYLAVYVDAVEWVELPNTLGMSQFADGGVMASKPYVASGKYIQRMSNYCAECPYEPGQSTGEEACPFTTLYWDFLMRHESLLRKNPRMQLQLRNSNRLSPQERRRIRRQADQVKAFASNRENP
jgi:deoxyribodipyrimidine photolyase-related protein